MNVQTILVPTDFSSLSDQAIEMGVSFARAFSARLVIVHVMNRPEDTDELSAAYDEFYAYTRDRISGLLEELCERIQLDGVEADWELVIGVPHREIIRSAIRNNADLIAMGTHGRQGFDRLLMGSQAEAVVRSAPCPVITAKGFHRSECAQGGGLFLGAAPARAERGQTKGLP